MGKKIWIGMTTVASRKEAESIAKSLVNSKLAACINIIPGWQSIYYWKGKLCHEKEMILLIKTAAGQLKNLIKEIKKLHSYQVPEIIFWEIKRGEEKYLEWVTNSVRVE